MDIHLLSSCLLLSCFSLLKATSHDNRSPWCIHSCQGVQQARTYHKCNTQCRAWIYCYSDGNYQIKTCINRKIWDNKKRKCVNPPSSTCKENPVRDDKTTAGLPSTSTSDKPETLDSKENTEKNPTKDPMNDSSSCPPDGLVLGVIPCQYVLLLSGLLGLIPLLVCLACKLYNHKSKPKTTKRRPIMVSTATQTVVDPILDVDTDSAIYNDLNLAMMNVDNRYTPLPYAITSNTGLYSEINVPTSNESNAGSAHDYLEILGYSYLQMQDAETRKEVSQTLAPLIVELCNKYKKDPTEYGLINASLEKCLNIKN